MPDLNVRNVDESWLRKVKADAAAGGYTLRDWVILRMAGRVDAGAGMDEKRDKLKSEAKAKKAVERGGGEISDQSGGVQVLEKAEAGGVGFRLTAAHAPGCFCLMCKPNGEE